MENPPSWTQLETTGPQLMGIIIAAGLISIYAPEIKKAIQFEPEPDEIAILTNNKPKLIKQT